MTEIFKNAGMILVMALYFFILYKVCVWLTAFRIGCFILGAVVAVFLAWVVFITSFRLH